MARGVCTSVLYVTGLQTRLQICRKRLRRWVARGEWRFCTKIIYANAECHAMRSYPFRKQDFEVHLQSISWANIFTTYPLHLTCEKQVWESFYVFLEYESLVVIAPAHAGLCHIPC